MDHLQILKKIQMIPVVYQQEVEDFIDFILQKKVIEHKKKSTERKLGLLKGKMKMADDFNAPIDDFKDYME